MFKNSVLLTILSFLSWSNLSLGASSINNTMSTTVMSQSDWDSLLNIIQKKGKILPSDFGDYLFIENKSKNEGGTIIKANYLSLVGSADASGQFRALRIEGVNEVWSKDADNNWQIDQWLFKINHQGKMTWGAHMVLVEKPEGTVLKHEYVEESDANLEAAWSNKLTEWYQFIKN
ncbi:MAG: hypothetical protein L6Q37_12495 [Bdellovibrionaceae bacterium]|nr:hypothetical protein [Pseudobdellovibrionaceae bacterium]NUM57283.1 hypothetical protein [Pseudobdellovibrionaceae bacterium]